MVQLLVQQLLAHIEQTAPASHPEAVGDSGEVPSTACKEVRKVNQFIQAVEFPKQLLQLIKKNDSKKKKCIKIQLTRRYF